MGTRRSGPVCSTHAVFARLIPAVLALVGTGASARADSRSEGLWRGSSLLVPRRGHTATLLRDGRILLVGGSSCRGRDDGNGSNKAEIFNPDTMVSEALPDLQIPRREHTATLMTDGRVIVVGGVVAPTHAGPMSATSAVEILSKRNGVWRWQPGPSLHDPRRMHDTVVLRDGRIAVIGGYDDHQAPTASVEVWDGKGTGWLEGPSLAAPSPDVRAFSLKDGRVVIVSGADHAEVANSRFRSWTEMPSPGLREWASPRRLTAVLLSGDRLLVAGPKDGELKPEALVKIWEPRLHSWNVVAKLKPGDGGPRSRLWGMGVEAKGEVVFLGYRAGEALSTNGWTLHPVDPSLFPLFDATATSLRDGRIVVAGGDAGRCDLAEIWSPGRYAIGQWSSTPIDWEPLAVLSDDRVVTVSAPDPMRRSEPRKTKVWDPATGQFGAPTPMTSPRERFSTTDLGDRGLLVVGGANEGKAIADSPSQTRKAEIPDPAILGTAEIYSPTANRWQAIEPLHQPRESHHALRLLDGSIMIAGGLYDTFGCDGDFPGAYYCHHRGPFDPATVEILSPSLDHWQVGAFKSPRGASFTLLADGRVLTAGGEADGRQSSIFDARSRSSVSSGRLQGGRSYHGAVRLRDGRVMVAGGLVPADSLAPTEARESIASVEIWSPQSGEWTAGPPLDVPTHRANAVQLPDGRVLITGSLSREGDIAMRPEIFDPETGRWTPVTPQPGGTRSCPPLLLSDGRVLLCRDLLTVN